MTRDQAKQNLIGIGIAEPTDEQVTNYLNQVNGETQKEKEKVSQYKDKAEQFDQVQADLEAERQKNMTAEEKLAEAEKAANEKAVEFAKKANRLDAEKILVGAGLVEEDYKDIIEGIVSDNAESTTALATSLAGMISKQKEAAVQKTREELMDETQTPGGASGSGGGEKTEAEKVAESIGKSLGVSEETKSVVDSYL